MKLSIIITIVLLSAIEPVLAQDSSRINYPLVVSFGSQCCGVPSETPLKNCIASFKKKYKIKKIKAVHIGPLGREGEYDIAFSLAELNKKQKKDLVTRVKKIKKLSADPGYLTVRENVEVIPAEQPKRASNKIIEF